MYYTVYKITNTITYKYYIGFHKTSNLNDGYMGSGKLIKAAINKYGSDKFVKEILFVFNNELDMKAKEKELVNEMVVKDPMSYNLVEGGKGGFGYINANGLNDRTGMTHSEESKQKMGSVMSEERRQDQSRRMKENTIWKYRDYSKTDWSKRTQNRTPLSEETKQKMSDNLKGTKWPKVTCPHCGKQGGENIMQRWHFNNCKNK